MLTLFGMNRHHRFTHTAKGKTVRADKELGTQAQVRGILDAHENFGRCLIRYQHLIRKKLTSSNI